MYASVQPLDDLYADLLDAGAYRTVTLLAKRRLNSGDPSVLYHYARALGFLGRDDEGCAAMERAWSEAKDPRALEYLSRELSGRNEMDRLRTILQEAVSLGRKTPALRLLGDLHADLNEDSDAEDMFQSAIEAGDYYAMLDYASFLRERGHDEGALRFARRALYYADDKAAWTVAKILFESDRLEEAQDAAIGAVRAGYLAASIVWAQVVARRGDNELAAACLEDALDDGVRDADLALEALRQGELSDPTVRENPDAESHRL